MSGFALEERYGIEHPDRRLGMVLVRGIRVFDHYKTLRKDAPADQGWRIEQALAAAFLESIKIMEEYQEQRDQGAAVNIGLGEMIKCLLPEIRFFVDKVQMAVFPPGAEPFGPNEIELPALPELGLPAYFIEANPSTNGKKHKAGRYADHHINVVAADLSIFLKACNRQRREAGKTKKSYKNTDIVTILDAMGDEDFAPPRGNEASPRQWIYTKIKAGEALQIPKE